MDTSSRVHVSNFDRHWAHNMEYMPPAPKMSGSSNSWMDFSRDAPVDSMSSLSASSSQGVPPLYTNGEFKPTLQPQQEEDDNDGLHSERTSSVKSTTPRIHFPSQRGRSNHNKLAGHAMIGDLKEMKSKLEDEKAKLKRDLDFMQSQLSQFGNGSNDPTKTMDNRESDNNTVVTSTSMTTATVMSECRQDKDDASTLTLHDQAEDLRQAVMEEEKSRSTEVKEVKKYEPKESVKFERTESRQFALKDTRKVEPKEARKVEPKQTKQSEESDAKKSNSLSSHTGIALQELQKALAVCNSSLGSKPITARRIEQKKQAEAISLESSKSTSKSSALNKNPLRFDLAEWSKKSKSARSNVEKMARELKFDLPAAVNPKETPIDSTSLERIKTLMEKVEAHEQTIREIKQEKQKLTKECEKMRDQAKEHRETVLCLENHLEDTSSRETLLRKELEEAKRHNASVKTNIAGADVRVKDAEDKLMKYAKELEASGVLIGVLGVKLENQNKMIQNLTEKEQDLIVERDAMKRQIEDQAHILDGLESQLEEAGNRECFLRKELNSAKELAEELSTSSAQQQQVHRSESAQTRVSELEGLVSQYEEEAQADKGRIGLLSDENKELRAINCEVGERVMNQAEQHRQIVEHLEEQLRDAMHRENEVRQELDSVKQIVEEAHRTNEALRRELLAIRNSAASTDRDRSDREEMLEKALEESQMEASAAKDDLIEALRRIRILEDELYDVISGSDDEESQASYDEEDNLQRYFCFAY